MKSTPPELSNDGSHDAKSEHHQKLIIIDFFPGRHLIRNISEIRNGTRQEKCFFVPTFYDQLFGIYCQGQFSVLGFVIFNTEVSSTSFFL